MSSYRNIKSVSISTDGVTGLDLGEVMLDGSTFPDTLGEQNDGLADGRFLSAGKTAAYVLRIINPNATQTATLQTAEEAGSDIYVHIFNRSNTEEFVLGPAKVTGVDERPPVGTPARGSILFGFNVAGDTGRDFMSVSDPTTT